MLSGFNMHAMRSPVSSIRKVTRSKRYLAARAQVAGRASSRARGPGFHPSTRAVAQGVKQATGFRLIDPHHATRTRLRSTPAYSSKPKRWPRKYDEKFRRDALFER